MFNLNKLKKSELVEMTKLIDGEAGDYARLGKDHYANLLSRKSRDVLIAAAANIGVVLEEVVDAEQLPAEQPKQESIQFETKAPELDGAAIAQLVAALGHLIKPGLDRDGISAIVKEELANSELPTKKIVVNGPKRVEMDEHTHPEFEDVLLYAGLRQNIMLVGPAGTGKTHLSSQVARALGLEFASISCTAGMSEATIKGRLLPTGEGGKFEYMESDFVRLYENGGVFLLDEIDAADANVLMIINQALANGGFFIEYRGEGQTFVKRHPDFVCIAAANTFGHGADMIYAGRERLDAATLERF